jgi:trehalose/maltose transport system substrate-binding protein
MPVAMCRAGWLFSLLLWLGIAGDGTAATLSISCGAVGQELALCRAGAEAWAKRTGNSVRIISTPNSTTERLALYQQLLAAGAEDVDVFQIDVIWPGILASHLVDLNPDVGKEVSEYFPSMIANNTVAGRLVALPWFSDAGLLYYRRDLLKKYGEQVPQTWGQLRDTALRIQRAERKAGDEGMWGYVWQGRAYEGLTCNALEWLVSHGGGTVVDEAGAVTVDNPRARAALERAAGWVGTISPPGVLNYAEEEARGVFQSGNAVFMRNWPYAWPLSQGEASPVRGRVGVARLPRAAGEGGRHAATLGGWSLAVSRYSRHPALATELVRYLTGEAEQRRRALVGSYNPTRPALYRDAAVLEANPFFAELADIFSGAVPRPSTVTGGEYNRVSSAFWGAVHSVLSGRASAKSALTHLERQLNRLRHRGGW